MAHGERPATSGDHPASTTLLHGGDCLLVIVDVPAAFADRLHADVRDHLLERFALIATSARWLQIPTLIMVERLEAWSETHPAVAGASASGTPLRKEVFELGAHPAVLEAVAAVGRGTVAPCGMETGVCVAQSALILRERGYGVGRVADAVASPDDAGHQLGLQRMRGAGVVLLSVQQLHYEWVCTVARARSVGPEHPEVEDRLP